MLVLFSSVDGTSFSGVARHAELSGSRSDSQAAEVPLALSGEATTETTRPIGRSIARNAMLRMLRARGPHLALRHDGNFAF